MADKNKIAAGFFGGASLGYLIPAGVLAVSSPGKTGYYAPWSVQGHPYWLIGYFGVFVALVFAARGWLKNDIGHAPARRIDLAAGTTSRTASFPTSGGVLLGASDLSSLKPSLSSASAANAPPASPQMRSERSSRQVDTKKAAEDNILHTAIKVSGLDDIEQTIKNAVTGLLREGLTFSEILLQTDRNGKTPGQLINEKYSAAGGNRNKALEAIRSCKPTPAQEGEVGPPVAESKEALSAHQIDALESFSASSSSSAQQTKAAELGEIEEGDEDEGEETEVVVTKLEESKSVPDSRPLHEQMSAAVLGLKRFVNLANAGGVGGILNYYASDRHKLKYLLYDAQYYDRVGLYEFVKTHSNTYLGDAGRRAQMSSMLEKINRHQEQNPRKVVTSSSLSFSASSDAVPSSASSSVSSLALQQTN